MGATNHSLMCDSTMAKGNEYILSGYRTHSNSWAVSIVSIFAIHNETGLLFGLIPIYALNEVYPRGPTAGLVDVMVFAIFFCGVAVCFLLSASFHVLNSHSSEVAAFANQLDYVGIVLLMWSATIPTVHYGFYDDAKLQVSLLAALCSAATVNPTFRTPASRPYRAATYASLGFSTLVVIIHGIALHGWSEQYRRMSLGWVGLMGAFNVLGAVIYAARIPERVAPGAFDIFCSSHQILHLMVVLGELTHMRGLLQAFDYVHEKLNEGRDG